MITTILSFIFVLGVLIFFHELGHFLVAKKVGIRVERFSLGFPPYIFSKTHGETIYSIGLIPLGGFVKMTGENPDETATGDPAEFMSKSPGKRALVIFAGPLMNYLLALVLMVSAFYFFGVPIDENNPVVIVRTQKDSPAATAGLRLEDEILAVNGRPVRPDQTVADLISPALAVPVDLSILRGDDTVAVTVTTMAVKVLAASGDTVLAGRIGVELASKIVSYRDCGIGEALSIGFFETHGLVFLTAVFVKQLAFGQMPASELGGPLYIAGQSGKVARKGIWSLLRFMAMLSVNLAVLNILPIPILDGGHLLFIAIEKLKGSPVSLRVRLVAQQAGVVVLLTLMVFVTYNDILKVFNVQ